MSDPVEHRPVPGPPGVRPPVVRTPGRSDLVHARGILVEALADDPGWCHVVPDAAQRRVALRALVGVALADAGRHARVAVRDGRIAGAACWQPPGRYPMGVWRQLRAVPRMVPITVRLGRRARHLQRFGQALDALFPDDPVRYLQILGVAPAGQRQGVGAALLSEGLAAADAGGEAVYLETGKPANVAYYERHGFALVQEGGPVYEGGPVMWRMLRPPRR